jgi:hypothetical protein
MNLKFVSNSSSHTGLRALLIAVVPILAVHVAHALPVTVEAGVAIVETSGLRRYAAQRFLTENRTSSLAAPQLRVSVPVGERFVAGAGYGSYATFRGHGVAPSSDVFNEGGNALTVMTPFDSAEKINEASIDLRYQFAVANGIWLEAGPTLSLFHSRAKIARRSFTENDVRLGGAVNFRCPLNDRWAVRAGYRYAAPPDRKLHLFVLTASRTF